MITMHFLIKSTLTISLACYIQAEPSEGHDRLYHHFDKNNLVRKDGGGVCGSTFANGGGFVFVPAVDQTSCISASQANTSPTGVTNPGVGGGSYIESTSNGVCGATTFTNGVAIFVPAADQASCRSASQAQAATLTGSSNTTASTTASTTPLLTSSTTSPSIFPSDTSISIVSSRFLPPDPSQTSTSAAGLPTASSLATNSSSSNITSDFITDPEQIAILFDDSAYIFEFPMNPNDTMQPPDSAQPPSLPGGWDGSLDGASCPLENASSTQSTQSPTSTSPSTTPSSTSPPSTTLPSTTPSSTTLPSTTSPSRTPPSTTAPSVTPPSMTLPTTGPEPSGPRPTNPPEDEPPEDPPAEGGADAAAGSLLDFDTAAAAAIGASVLTAAVAAAAIDNNSNSRDTTNMPATPPTNASCTSITADPAYSQPAGKITGFGSWPDFPLINAILNMTFQGGYGESVNRSAFMVVLDQLQEVADGPAGAYEAHGVNVTTSGLQFLYTPAQGHENEAAMALPGFVAYLQLFRCRGGSNLVGGTVSVGGNTDDITASSGMYKV